MLISKNRSQESTLLAICSDSYTGLAQLYSDECVRVILPPFRTKLLSKVFKNSRSSAMGISELRFSCGTLESSNEQEQTEREQIFQWK